MGFNSGFKGLIFEALMALTLNTTSTACWSMTLCVLMKCYQDSQGTSPKAAPTVHCPEDEALPFSEILVSTFYKGRHVPDDTTKLSLIMITAII